MSDAPSKAPRNLLLAAGLATAGLLLWLALEWPFGVPGEWVWRPNEIQVHLWPALIVALLVSGVCWAVSRPGPWEEAPAVARAGWMALLILGIFALQVALLNAAGVPVASPGAIIASPVATTYYSVSLEVRDWRGWLAAYPEQMRALPYHARTHPPGFIVFFLLLRRAAKAVIPHPSEFLHAAAEVYRVFGIGPSATDAAAAMAAPFLMSLIGALSVCPLYLLGRDLVGPGAGVCAAALAAGIPALLLFGASPDLIVLAVAVTTLWLSYSAWRRSSLVRAFLAGLLLALGLFLSLGLLSVAGWLGLWALLGIVRSRQRSAIARRAVLQAAVGGAGLVCFYAALYFAFGYRPLAVAREGLFAHRGVTAVEAGRSYWNWLLMNPVEAAAFAGVPLVAAAIWSAFRRPEAGGLGRGWSFLGAWLITLALLDLSGTVRGEVGRIWLFLMWPLALAAAPRLAGRQNRAWVVAALSLLSMWQAIVMRGYLTLYDIR